MNGGGGILVDKLVVEYQSTAGSVRALDQVSLTVDRGQSLAVTGPSGGGKSTLLGVLGGLARPASGVVSVGGQAISTLSERDRGDFRRRHIGFVYQADNLLPFLTVIENVQLQYALVGQYADVQRSLGLLEQLGLAGKAYLLPDQLSGGQRQRAAVARAVVHRPQLLLADEPTGALDSANAAGVIDLLLAMQHEVGATLVMVTHDRQAASRLDLQLELRDGRIG